MILNLALILTLRTKFKMRTFTKYPSNYIKASNYKITMDYVDDKQDNYHSTTYTNSVSGGIEVTVADYIIQYHRRNSHAPTKDEISKARTHIRVEEID